MVCRTFFILWFYTRKNTIERSEEDRGESFDTTRWDLDWNTVLRPSVDKIQRDIERLLTEEETLTGAMCLIIDEGMGKSTVLKMVMEQSNAPTSLLKVETIVRDGDWTVKTLLTGCVMVSKYLVKIHWKKFVLR